MWRGATCRVVSGAAPATLLEMPAMRGFGTVLVAALVLVTARTAPACRFLPIGPHRVDRQLAERDTSAPDAPVVVAVDTYRRMGMTCTEASCVANTCGDTAAVRIELAPSADESVPELVGYRLGRVSGSVPDSIAPMLGVDLAGGAPLFLRPGFDEAPGLDVTLEAVAIDAAGNESRPSAPFRVEFAGCTLAAVGDACQDDVEPRTDLSVLVDGSGVAEEADVTVRGD